MCWGVVLWALVLRGGYWASWSCGLVADILWAIFSVIVSSNVSPALFSLLLISPWEPLNALFYFFFSLFLVLFSCWGFGETSWAQILSSAASSLPDDSAHHRLLLLLLPSRSVVSSSVRPHRRQPMRLLCPWDSPGKVTGVGYHCLLCHQRHSSLLPCFIPLNLFLVLS